MKRLASEDSFVALSMKLVAGTNRRAHPHPQVNPSAIFFDFYKVRIILQINDDQIPNSLSGTHPLK
jgi:hypothetical protein